MQLTFSRPDGNRFPVVTVSGDVDVSTAPELRAELVELLESGVNSAVVDLDEIEFLDSSGLGALIDGRTKAMQGNGELVLVCTQPRILKLFEITGLDGVFSIYPDVATALAGLAPPRAD
ncbi:MAG: STAS domain-containing protein [Trebonia sp.]